MAGSISEINLNFAKNKLLNNTMNIGQATKVCPVLYMIYRSVMELTKKKCTPCKGGVPPLKGKELREYLNLLNGWLLVNEEKIRKTYVFENFIEAIDFVIDVGSLAEDEGHHPDLSVHYNHVTIDLWTHKISGLYENDFILAAKIDLIKGSSKIFSNCLS